MTVFTKLKCWGSGEISKSWNSWMESAEIVCVRGKLGDLLTCSKNFCVNKRQLLPVSRFAAKLQYILPLRSYNMRLQLQARVMFLIEISTSLFEGLRGCLTLSQKKGTWRGWRARSPCSFDFFSNTFERKQLLFIGLPFSPIFIDYTWWCYEKDQLIRNLLSNVTCFVILWSPTSHFSYN